MKISPARTCAFDVLLRVETDRAHSSVLLAEKESGLEPRDRALCHEIVLGTLRNQMLLDSVIESISSKKTARLDAEVLVALRMGLYQLRFLDKVPEYAAVKDSVELVVRGGKRSARGFANAILRKAAREWPDSLPSDPVRRLSVIYSHPDWLVERWIRAFGAEKAEALLKYNNQAPNSDFRFTRKFDLLAPDQQEQISEKLGSGEFAFPSELIEGSFTAKGRSELLDGLNEQGLIYFQDEGSQMVALSALPVSGSFLDLCAAPGSKTTYIARHFDASEGLFAACDISAGRAKVLKRICTEQALDPVEVIRADGEAELPFEPDAFDTVLVDAPCTGTGTIAQNPELRYFLKPEDPAALADKQLRILRNASKVVKPGGRIIYSTCSLEEEENAGVAEKFLREFPDFRPETPRLPERFVGEDLFARTVPQRDGLSGFFIAVFRRSG